MIFKCSELDRATVCLTKHFERGKSVRIDPVTVSRSLSQNAYSWLVFTYVGQETGNTKEDVYAFCLKKFPVFKEVNINGVIELGQVTLSEMNKDQNSKFIDEFTTYFRSEGFAIPDPEDKKAIDMYNWYKERNAI